jgi:hypothetical protein
MIIMIMIISYLKLYIVVLYDFFYMIHEVM